MCSLLDLEADITNAMVRRKENPPQVTLQLEGHERKGLSR